LLSLYNIKIRPLKSEDGINTIEPKKSALCRTEGRSHAVEGAIIPTAALLFLKKGNEPKKSAL